MARDNGVSSNPLAALTSVDGAGSLLDADFLDGLSSASFALDSAVVHNTGGETIAGAKSFSSQATFTAGNTTKFNRASFPTFLLELVDNGTTRGYIGADSSNCLSISNASTSSMFTVSNSTGDFGGAGLAGILQGTAIPAGGTTGTGYRFSSTSNFGVFFGSGAPSLSAAKGSLYLRSDGSGTNNRAYINTDGGTTWTAVVTVA